MAVFPDQEIWAGQAIFQELEGNTDDPRKWVLTAKLPKAPLYQLLRAYQQTRDAATGFNARSGTQRKGGRAGIPQFRAYCHDKESSVAWQVQAKSGKAYVRDKIDRPNRRVKLPNIGWQRWRDKGRVLDRALAGDARVDTMRLVRSQEGVRERWHVVFDVTYEAPDAVGDGQVVGVDLGVASPAVTSDGGHFGRELKTQLKTLEKRRRRLQRQLSRQFFAAAKQADALTDTGAVKPGCSAPRSNRYRQTNDRLAKVSRQIQRLRKNWASETANRLTLSGSTIVLENLITTNMTASAKGTVEEPGKNVKAKSGLNREILNSSWGELEHRLAYGTSKNGGQLVKVSPAYTSQTCAVCGEIDAKSRKGRRYECTSCGYAADADENAALVIRQRGIEKINAE